ncbi:exodeoxyribonuclease V subunit alpha [Uruburuella testudinis]|uniref:RecBCD enzyme subunit RecD n=1 Tax=Uruburuella testudinis TaxID=1282863 RepID=A0ABY4DQ55_9NEIS|nr:exodeoxyribonuclease V subunit alpha [Uruburuella testudinis]UOO81198.1 exodeoxyribonuclease V subunit alpha [Uruburuella testudinis]
MSAISVEAYQAAADAAVMLLQRHAPQAAGCAAPYLPRLFAALSDGHSFIWLDEAEAAALAAAQPVVGSGGDTPLVLAGRRLFLGRMWQLERDLAAEIVRLAKAPLAPADWMRAGRNLQDWFAGQGSEGQRDAAALALLQPFMLISGGPGTGKTTTVAKLLGLLCDGEAQMPSIALAAPTGKAAAHMARALHRALADFDLSEPVRSHLLQLEGQTVHRLLKLRPPQMRPLFDAEQPLALDVLIVDEASMLDIALLLQLLRAVPTGCRVVLLGDENQLPSVGAGAVLAALAQPTLLGEDTARELQAMLPQHGFQTAALPLPLSQNVARLKVSHRFGDNSGIGCLARAVAAEDVSAVWAAFDRFPDDLQLRERGSREQAEAIYALQADYWQAVDAGDVAQAFARQTDVVVLAAWRDDAEAFNQAYRRCLQQHGRVRADAPWFAGQVLMIERNDYALNVFNGDIGLVLPDEEGVLSAWFAAAQGYRKIPLSRLSSYATAFAMTVHKSQGSEYRDVWLLPPSVTMPSESGGGLNKALLYTAVTRARERFVFWGSRAAFQTACTADEQRRSSLREMIGRAWGGEL